MKTILGAPMTPEHRAEWERGRDLNAELREALADATRGRWARKTEFLPLSDGRVRRRIVRSDGTVEKDEVIADGRLSVIVARAEAKRTVMDRRA